MHRAKVGGQEIEQSTFVGLGPDGLIRLRTGDPLGNRLASGRRD